MVPPGGGEQDYTLPFDLPSVPNAGDYISIMRTGSYGFENFIVRRTWWQLEYPKTADFQVEGQESIGKLKELWVECEFAYGPHDSENHKKGCDAYKKRHELHGKFQPIKSFDESMF
jgi:hypothetical protein